MLSSICKGGLTMNVIIGLLLSMVLLLSGLVLIVRISTKNKHSSKTVIAASILTVCFVLIVGCSAVDIDNSADHSSDIVSENDEKTVEKAKEDNESQEEENKNSVGTRTNDESTSEKKEVKSEEENKNENQVEKVKEKNEVVTPPNSREGKTNKEEPHQSSNQVSVTLVRVVDGDTIRVMFNGKEETVRYLLIDTPETKSPNTCVQPYGEEAHKRNEQLLKSGKITLEFEKSLRDKYDRLLAYVFVDGKSVQETLLEEGLARVAYIYEPPYKYLTKFEQAEKRAKDAKKNIWSENGYATDNGFQGCVNDSNSKNSSSSSNSDKQSSTSKNTNTSTSKNTEASKNSNISKNDDSANVVQVDFKNCTELRKVYPKGVSKEHPAYKSKMDRDKDGWACEVAS